MEMRTLNRRYLQIVYFESPERTCRLEVDLARTCVEFGREVIFVWVVQCWLWPIAVQVVLDQVHPEQMTKVFL